MIKRKNLVLSLLTAIFCAVSACAILKFGTSIPYARATTDEPAHGYEHTTALGTDTAIADGGKYYLNGNLTRNITIPVDCNVELCLNGKTLTGAGADYVITVNNGATLTLHDCSGDNSGTITCGSEQTTCVFTDGSFDMLGGKIVGNGGSEGIYVTNGRTSMSGGEISGHSVGVHIKGGSFEMTDGTISENQTGVQNDMNFKVSGSPQISDNDVNVRIKSGKHIEVHGKLEEGAHIGITLESTGIFTEGYTEEGNTEHPSKYFFSDNPAYKISLNNGEAEISATVEIAGIEAVFNQGDTLIYSTTELDSLKANLVVKVVNNDGSYANNGTPLNDSDYTLSGELATSESVITVTYGTYKTTFTVTVSIESPCDPPVDDPGVTPKPADGKEGNLLWLVITLSVILLADVGILIYQLIGRKKSGTDKENVGGNK